MIANNEPRAYIVHATEDAMRSLSDFDFTFTPKETFRNAETLDLDALRLVVEAAKWAQSARVEAYLARGDYFIKGEEKDEWHETMGAIVKIEAILK